MIISIEGQMGSGKTLTSTLLGHSAYKQGRKVLSNYELKFPYQSYKPEDLYHLNETNFQLHNCMFLLDEGYLVVDSRNSMSKLNRLFNYWSVQTRKRNVDVVIATHEFKRLDQRIRFSVQMRIGCKFDEGVPRPQVDSNNKILLDNRNNPIPLLDKHGDIIYLRAPSLKLNIRNFVTNQFKVKRIPNIHKFFKLYNTYELVKVPENLILNAAERREISQKKEQADFLAEALDPQAPDELIDPSKLDNKEKEALIRMVAGLKKTG